MSEKGKIFDSVEDVLRSLSSLDGKIIGDDLQPSKLRLAKSNKGAVVNDVVDKYLRRELTNEFLQQAREEYGITARNIVREIAKREIEKVLGI